MSKTSCYHCGLPVPDNLDLTVTINGQVQPMCCPGCQAVAQAIVEAGLQNFYTYRTNKAPTGQELVPEILQQTKVYDNPAVQKRLVHFADGNLREVALILEGITCAACIWLNEQHLRTLPGVLTVQVNYATHRARVQWDDSQIHLSEILQAISRIGYLAHPYDPQRQQEILARERKQQLRRLGVAGVLGMQVMMFSLALYTGAWYGIETEFKTLFYWLNLLLTIPILLYSAAPFFNSAWRDFLHRQAGMDVPVSLGLSLAFIGSLWTTLSGGPGEVYYDSIAMFVFFLLTGRYFELMARQKSTQAAESLVHLVPMTATRLRPLEESMQEEVVLVADLKVGETVLVRPGETIPADGTILVGHSNIDESLLTGESYPLPKQPGQPVLAGTINIHSPLQVQVDKIGMETVLSHILRLLERAQSEKPAITQLADKVASWFVLSVLLLAAGVAFYWWQVNSEAWLSITLAVLVVTCPCALSLATPTAITAATSTLTRAGLLTTRGHALETLARATHFVFDKTGTLTEGQLRLLATHSFASFSEERCLQLAVALERHSEHPIAQALIQELRNSGVQEFRSSGVQEFRSSGVQKFRSSEVQEFRSSEIQEFRSSEVQEFRSSEVQEFRSSEIQGFKMTATKVNNIPGAGMQGEIAGITYFIGTPTFIATQTNLRLEAKSLQQLQRDGHTLVLLADFHTLYAAFVLGDNLRTGARELIQALQQRQKRVILLSGDHAQAVQRVAQAVGIQDVGASLTPADKLKRVKELQAQGAIVAVIGDGVNDAPVLAQAQVSIAMGSGTQIARASADMILLTGQLSKLLVGIDTAQQMLQIIRQNLIWAIGYNLLALPAAALGWVVPWIAALGMSLSSLLVVTNALRLLKLDKR